jgi:reversibly glycosylated polypeptide/UDP-arabinopyranose mutase
MNKKIFLVIPTIRNLDFLNEWKDEFESVHIIIVEDHDKKEIKIPKIRARSIAHFTQKDVDTDLKEKAWIIPRKSAAIRSYGFWKAWQQSADIIITIDDDCFPDNQNFVQKYIDNLSISVPRDWTPTYPFRDLLFTRGFPYKVRNEIPVKLSHGLWSNVPDFDGLTQLMSCGKTYSHLPDILHSIPIGMFFPMSAMNIAFKAEITVLMYQLLMGYDRYNNKLNYDRFDDIWCGLFAKKIIDHLQWGTLTGSPFVTHKRASNVFTNIKKEATGIEKNETLWESVKAVNLTQKDPVSCYLELANKIEFPKEEYFSLLKRGMIEWANLFTN